VILPLSLLVQLVHLDLLLQLAVLQVALHQLLLLGAELLLLPLQRVPHQLPWALLRNPPAAAA